MKKGGHDIPVNIIIRRYQRGISNLFSLYSSLCDLWLLVDNSLNDLQVVAEGEFESVNEIKNPDIWDKISKQADAFKA